jgi:drug/metabolite transporter (DMT)-like permease
LNRKITVSFGKGELLAVVSVVCISFGVVYQRAASISVDPIAGSFINILPVFVGGMIYSYFSKGTAGALFGKPTLLAIAAGIGGSLSANVIGLPVFLKALSYGGAAIVTPIVASSAIWAGLLARILVKQPIAKNTLSGFCVFMLGMVLLMVGQTRGIPLNPQWYWAIPLALIVAILYGITMSLTAYSLANGLSQGGSVAISGGTGLVGLGMMTMIGRQNFTLLYPDSYKLIFAGILQIAGLIASTAAFSRTSVVSVGTILVTNIIWTSLLTWAFLGDSINLLMAVALVLALLGLIIVQYSRSKRNKKDG